jgi:thymidylate synthase ThyX
MIEAAIICDSVSEQGKRLTTFQLRYPRFIHAEFMTHRVISRNASSSRAVPTAKLIEEVRSDALRAAPIFWGKNQKGMQAAEELSDEPTYTIINQRNEQIIDLFKLSPKELAQDSWRRAAQWAAEFAEQMELVGAHKQIVNRILEPFTHINVVATATEWDNFFGLRLDAGAQPEMKALAVAMWEARQKSIPLQLRSGEWHLPFIDHIFSTQNADHKPALLLKISVARCARVSYTSFETGKQSTLEEDLALYDRLLTSQPLHASPAEHQATPDTYTPCYPQQWGNFVGWRQYRKMLPGEAVAPLPKEYL